MKFQGNSKKIYNMTPSLKFIRNKKLCDNIVKVIVIVLKYCQQNQKT